MKPTTEQLDIIETAKTGVNLAISAFAGAAKTTTCILVANEVTNKSLYIAFNKAIADEAKNKFPGHVECRTLHSLAFETIVKGNYKLAKRLKASLDSREILSMFESAFGKDMLNYKARIAEVRKYRKAISEFCQSSARDIKEFSYEIYRKELIKELRIKLGSFDEIDYDFVDESSEIASDRIELLWNALTNIEGTLTISHDIYLKMYHLQNPNLHLAFKTIYLDEAQDSNDLTLDIVFRCASKGSQIILVGDTYQSIYAWRGAINAFKKIPDSFVRLNLTTSFRFHQEIADVANKFLNELGCGESITGAGVSSDCYDKEDKALLCRTNARVFKTLVSKFMAGEKVYCSTDFSSFFKALYHGLALRYNKEIKFPYAPFVDFENWDQFTLGADLDDEVGQVVEYINSYGSELYDLIPKAKQAIVDKPGQGILTVTTMHKSKGLEWEVVELADDFANQRSDESYEAFVRRTLDNLKENQLGEILYVAVTRAKQKLILPKLVTDMFKGNICVELN